MRIEFRPRDESRTWFYVLVDDESKGWINEDGVLWRLTLWLGREIDRAESYGSLETAMRKAREHYEGAFDFPEAIGG